MDREHFDALTRLVKAKHGRRSALFALIGAALLGRHPAPTLARCRKKEGKEKRQCRRKAHGKNVECLPLYFVCNNLFPNGLCCPGAQCTGTFTPFVTA